LRWGWHSPLITDKLDWPEWRTIEQNIQVATLKFLNSSNKPPRVKILLAFLFFFAHTSLLARPKITIQEKLGYPRNTKLLIIHADDLGVSHSENEASIAGFEKGVVNSGSIMVPCPWFLEIAAYSVAHPQVDLGLHLTLNSEWKLYKWGPVLPRTEVPSLIDSQGFLPDNVPDLAAKAKVEEVEKELRAQVERAKQFGIDPTHFDLHMFSLAAVIDFAKVYMRLGHDYGVPTLLNAIPAKVRRNIELRDYISENDVVADKIFIALPTDFKGGVKNYYTKVIKSLSPGLNLILLHAAYDNSEMQAVTVDHPDYGAAWRQADIDFFTGEECKKLLKLEKIHLVTWREIRDKITRRTPSSVIDPSRQALRESLAKPKSPGPSRRESPIPVP
jgi:predicted glycoside hydrolase/deacetylase ChbG (UPF0249 family)